MPQCDVATFADNPNIYWSYCPSQPAAILFAVLYGLTASTHLIQAIIYRQRNAAIITTGALLEATAFILRLFVITTLDLYQVYEAQFVLILIAPMFMNAYDFVLLGRLVNYCMPDRKLLRIPAKKIAVIFICCDIGTFLVQLAGAAMTISTDQTTINNGLHIYTAGVVLQEFFILCFVCLAVVFYRRLGRECEPEKARRVRQLFWVIVVSLSLISFRIIFRIIEWAGSVESSMSQEIANHEIYLYLFDCVPMFFALLIFNIFHPGRYLVGPDAEWPKKTKDQKKAEKEEKKRLKMEKKLRSTQVGTTESVGLVEPVSNGGKYERIDAVREV